MTITRLGVAGAAALACLLLAASAAARPAAGTATRLTDATGDSGAAPDIRHVDVGNDVVEGHIVIWVETPNRAELEGDDVLLVLLDTDLNPGTGSDGIDYAVGGDASGTGALLRWDGTTFAQVPAPTLTWTQNRNWTRIGIHPDDLGGPRGFNFLVETANGDAFDALPDDTLGTYSLAAGPIPLTVEGFAASPKAPRAGRPFAAGLVVGRNDTAELLTQGKITCTARLAGARLPARAAWAGDGAACRVVLGKKAKGKLLVLTVKVTYGGKSVSRTFRGKVR